MQREHGESCRICRRHFYISFSLFTVATRANARNKRFVKYAHTYTQHTHTATHTMKIKRERIDTRRISRVTENIRAVFVSSLPHSVTALPSRGSKLNSSWLYWRGKIVGKFFRKILYNHLPRKLSPCQKQLTPNSSQITFPETHPVYELRELSESPDILSLSLSFASGLFDKFHVDRLSP